VSGSAERLDVAPWLATVGDRQLVSCECRRACLSYMELHSAALSVCLSVRYGTAQCCTVGAPNASCTVRLLHGLMAVEEPARDENEQSTAGAADITSRLVQVGRSCYFGDDRAYRRAGQVAVERRKVSVVCR
jgi:hypothetical protein